jgi:hypothetical protein
MNNAQGGYRIIDFKGIDLDDEETLNNSIYPIIESAYKSKAFLITNIFINEVEHNSTFVSIKLNNSNYEFELYGYHIVVEPNKITCKAIKSYTTLYNYNISINDIANIYVINSEDANIVKARFHLNIYQPVSQVWSEPILRNLFPIVGTVTIEYDYNNNHYIAIGSIRALEQLNFSGSYYNQLYIKDFDNGVINTTTMEYETNVIPWGSKHPTQSNKVNKKFYLSPFEKTRYNTITINLK